MSEQKNNMGGMNFGTGSTLEELFGATIPQVDLGDQFPTDVYKRQAMYCSMYLSNSFR